MIWPLLASLSDTGEKQVPGWVAAWGGLALFTIWTSIRRFRGLGRIAPRGAWPMAAVFLTLIAGAVKLMVDHAAKRSDETLRWSSTSGVVVHSQLRREGSGLRVDIQSDRQDNGIRQGEYLDLRYRYEVDGIRHEGAQVTRDQTRLGKPDREWAQRYPVGRKVTVRYNPSNPAEAVLEGLSTGDGSLSDPALILLFAGSLVVLGFWERFLHGNSGPSVFDNV